MAIGGPAGAETNSAHAASSHSNRAQTRFSTVGSRKTVEPLEPWRARLAAPFLPNTSRNRSTFSTVVVARIMTVPFLPADWFGGRRDILRPGPGRGIGRPTHFRGAWGRSRQPATRSSTTFCLTAQRVAAARLETPILV